MIGWGGAKRRRERTDKDQHIKNAYPQLIDGISHPRSLLYPMIFDAKSFKAVSRTLDCRFHDVPCIEHHILTRNLLYEYVTYSTHTVLRESG